MTATPPNDKDWLRENTVWIIIVAVFGFLGVMLLAANLLGFLNSGSTPTTLSDCVAAAKDRDTFCRASGKADANNRSRGDCTLHLTAGRGRFFATSRPTVVSEHYDNKRGPRAAQSLKARRQGGLATEFTGQISCSKPAGQSCSARARIAAKSYPLSCAPHRAALRIY